MWDQNCKYNLEVRSIFEKIYSNYTGDKTAEEWLNLETYLKQLWMSNGIHHHYSNIKHTPKFSKEYFTALCAATSTQVSEEILEVIFNPNVAALKVESDASKGLVENSAVNFYEGVTTKEAFDYYASKEVAGDRAPLSYGINANLRKENGVIVDETSNTGWHDSQIELVGGTLRFSVWNNGTGFASTVATPLNAWYYVGISYNGTTLSAYVNGSSAGNATYSRATPYNNGGGVALKYGIALTDSTNLGNGGYGNFRWGAFQVYNTALNSSNVLQNYNAQKSRYGL
jgi:hypothetical protein